MAILGKFVMQQIKEKTLPSLKSPYAEYSSMRKRIKMSP